MSGVLLMVGAAWLAGLASFVGGVFAKFEGTAETEGKRELIHGISAFGGGILVSAIAFALVSDAIEKLPALTLILTFCAGGVAFCLVDVQLSRSGGSKAQLLAMLMDFVPEAIALGALFETDKAGAFLLALFIGAQNLPEGFNAFREISGKLGGRKALWALFGASFLGPLAAYSGHLFLKDMPELTSGIMCFAAGGILYLIFQDIAPQARMTRHWTPTLGAVLGFAVGMLGEKLLG